MRNALKLPTQYFDWIGFQVYSIIKFPKQLERKGLEFIHLFLYQNKLRPYYGNQQRQKITITVTSLEKK